MIIHTDRLTLRPITDSDLPHIFEGLSHPDVIPYYGVSFKTLEETKEQMSWYSNLVKNNTGFWWAVCDKADMTFLGAGGYNDMDTTHRKAEIGFWLLPKAWGKGYMQEAMPAIVQCGFDRLNLHRIEGFVDSENSNCKKAMAKLEFEHEGTMKECEMKNGKWVSVDIYAAINNEK